MTGKEMVDLLKQHGFTVDRVSGSHHIMAKGGLSIPVPVHGKRELATGAAHAILKKAGLK